MKVKVYCYVCKKTTEQFVVEDFFKCPNVVCTVCDTGREFEVSEIKRGKYGKTEEGADGGVRLP